MVEQADRTQLSESDHGTLYDVETGQALGTFQLPKYTRIAALSPDGRSMAVVSTNTTQQPDTLGIWTWHENTATLTQSLSLPDKRSPSVEWACFLNPISLLVRTNHAEAILLDLLTGQPRYSFKTGHSQTLAVSRGGQWIANFVGEGGAENARVEFYDGFSGTAVATIKPDFDESTVFTASSFSPDGRRFLLLLSSYGRRRHVGFCWDLQSGKSLFKFDVPFLSNLSHEAPPIWWCGSDYILIRDRLCRISAGLCVWRYPPSAVGQISNDRVWTIVEHLGRNYLAPMQLPLPSDEAEIERQFAAVRPLLRAGDSVRLEIRGAQAAPSRDYEDKLRSTIGERLRRAGYTVNAAGKMCLRLSVSEKTGGEPVRFEPQSRGGKPFTVPDRVLNLTTELVDANGVVKSTREDSYRISGLQINPGPDPVREVLDERWKFLTWGIERREFSSVYYEPDAEDGFGETELNAQNLVQAADAETREPGNGTGNSTAETPPVLLGHEWEYRQDRAPAPQAEFVSKRLKLSKGRLFDARFAGPEVGQVAVLMNLPSEQGELDSARTVQRLDLTNSEVLGSFGVATDAELADFRLDGRVIAIKLPSESRQIADRLEIWSCSNQGDKQFLQWAPYEGRSFSQLVWAALIGTNRLLTLDRTSTLDLWQLPERKRLASVGWKHSGYPPLSPQRKYVAVPRNDVVEILRTEDLGLVGQLLLPGASEGGLQGGAFDSEGLRLGLVMQRDDREEMTVWDLDKGKLAKRFPTRRSNPGHRWIDQRYFYAGGNLIDLDEETVAWQYEYETCMSTSPDGRFWYAAVGRESRPYLCATTIPSRQIVPIIERALIAGAVVKPGQTVSVQMGVEGSPAPDYCRNVMTAVQDSLAQRGFQLGHNASCTMQITVSDEPRERHTSLALPSKPGITQRMCSVTLKALDARGRICWYAHHVHFADFKASGEVDEGEQPPLQAFERWLESQVIPGKLFAWSETGAVGKSKLTFDKEEIRTDFDGR